MGVPAALSNRLWARLRARNAMSSCIVFSRSSRCSSVKGCTYLTIIPSSGRGAIVFGSIFAWWRSFQMQPVDMGDQLHFTGPLAEVETEHLVRTFGRRTPDPQADQQAGDQGHIHLYPHAVGRLTQQVPAA